MQRTNDDRWILSATDLVNFLGCPHLGALARGGALGLVPKPPRYDDPGLDALRARGLEHEQNYLRRLQDEGRRVVEIPKPAGDYPEQCAAGAAATLDAMRAGADVIYQAWLVDDRWAGRADFLVRVETPSALGPWSYEVVDTKLAREAKGGALLQILLYNDLLGKMQGAPPARVRLQLGGPDAREETFRVADYDAYYRSVRDRYLAWVDAPAGALAHAPDPVAHCDLCDWIKRCEAERREVDHLSFVAGITRRQRDALAGAGVATLAGLAAHPLPPDRRVPDIRDEPFTRVREQARVQFEGRERGTNVHELLLPVVADLGLASLPQPSPGDLFLDFEGDPFALTHGLEYLVGWADVDGNYTGRWALDRAGEKLAFEEFVDLVVERRRRWPDMHVYHYAPYERTALGKLMGLHATREFEVDSIFRSDVLVDLYRIVRQGVRASVESYSIKKMEPFYGFERGVELKAATRALVNFSAWLQAGIGERAPAMEATIEAYNRDDVLSTARLRDWLEQLRSEAERIQGSEIPRPVPRVDDEGVEERDDEISRLVERLVAGVPVEESERSPEQHGRWLMAHLLEYHRREDKPTWWAYFNRLKHLGDDELVEDRVSLGGIEHVEEVGPVARSIMHRFRFPPQEHGVKEGSEVADPEVWRAHRQALDEAAEGEKPKHPGTWTVVKVDDETGTLHLKKGIGNTAPFPRALVPSEVVPSKAQRTSLLGIATAVAESGLGDHNPHASAVDLLMRRPPPVSLSEEGGLAHSGEETVDAAIRITAEMSRGVLPIQGPPGAGKTFTASHLIAAALKAGKKVGVTANSHAVITHVLDKVCELSEDDAFEIRGIQKDGGEGCKHDSVELTKTNDRMREALDEGANLAAGTAWLWSREEMVGAVDILVIDEAGQMALANALAVAPATKVLVLVGDPQQLEQPVKGTHPPGVGVSALNHLLRDHNATPPDLTKTIPSDRGLFLDKTRRLHPAICRFTSEMFYEGRLEAWEGLDRQRVMGPMFDGSGLILVQVLHAGNTTESVEEASAIAELVSGLVGSHSWIDRNGCERKVTESDILVVAPYNVQVGAISARVPDGVKVGTVDKFQGREAPVVIYSTTSSTAEDAPRGMDFLYSPNRLNVATSRAMCLAVVVAAPAIFAPECRSPAQMKLANAFCRFAELAAGFGR